MSKTMKRNLNISGTKFNSQNSQLLISSGIPSLDELLGGGVPIGTVCVIEEDKNGSYAKIILKYFLVEGVVSKHVLFVGSHDVEPENIVSELPAPTDYDPDSTQSNNDTSNNKMRIAFRYQNLPTSENEPSSHFGHYYDLTKTLPEEQIKTSDIEYWALPETVNAPNTFAYPGYHDLLQAIKRSVHRHDLSLTDPTKAKTVLRIGLHSVGSPVWLPTRSSVLRLNKNRDLDMFIFCLRTVIRTTNAVAFVTVPAHLYDENSMGRCIHAADIALKLQAFAGTELENNPSLSDYHGFFHLSKLAAVNSFASKHPGSVEYGFKLRRKKFCIEKLHLPPDISDTSKEETKGSLLSMGCGSGNRHLLEF